MEQRGRSIHWVPLMISVRPRARAQQSDDRGEHCRSDA
jgi:hypothetical protein